MFVKPVAALPIGGRVKLDPWLDQLNLLKSKPVGAVAEREKMPFEVTPFMPYLTRYNISDAAKPTNASATDAKPPEAASATPADAPSKP